MKSSVEMIFCRLRIHHENYLHVSVSFSPWLVIITTQVNIKTREEVEKKVQSTINRKRQSLLRILSFVSRFFSFYPELFAFYPDDEDEDLMMTIYTEPLSDEEVSGWASWIGILLNFVKLFFILFPFSPLNFMMFAEEKNSKRNES